MKSLSLPRAGFRPHVEALEDRSVPALVTVVGSTMTILGDDSNERVEITDNGDGDLRVVHGPRAVVLAGGGTVEPLHHNITRIDVRMHGGRDTVNYLQEFDRTRNMAFNVRLGGGADDFLADIEGDLDNRRMVVVVDGRDGNDSITVDATVDATTGPDGFGAVDPIGADIGPYGALILDLDGGGGGGGWPPDWSLGKDTIKVDYRGVLDGLLWFAERGHGGRDHLRADVRVDCGSDGVLSGVLNGGQGRDHLYFHIHEACPDDRFSIALAVAIGGGGDDSFDLSPQVRRRGRL